MTPQVYLSLLSQAETLANRANTIEDEYLAFGELDDRINALSHDERRALRGKLQALGCTKLLQNLFFDYSKQVWI